MMFLNSTLQPQKQFILVLVGVMIILAACGGSPKGKAADWADRFPEKYGDWELSEDRLELTAENQSNNGHVTLIYENDDDVRVDISIDVYATTTAADVVHGERVRDWELLGIRFERIRPAGYDVAMMPGGYLAYLVERETIFTLSIIPPIEEPNESDDADADNTDAEATEATVKVAPLVVVDEATIEEFQELISAVVSNK